MNCAVRVYCPRPYKHAYVFVKNEIVTHASGELTFTIGWTKSKVLERAEAAGFKTSTITNMTTPRPTWSSKKPQRKK